MVWFAVPFFMATTFGLAGRSLSMAKGLDFITLDDANNGLVPAKVIVETLGTGGAFALLLQLFMAVTSTGSSEIIAVSSVLTCECMHSCLFHDRLWFSVRLTQLRCDATDDLYWTYLNPELKQGVARNKKNWDAAVAKAKIVDEPSTTLSEADSNSLLTALKDCGWAKEGLQEDYTGASLLAGGSKLFEVKMQAVSDVGQESECVILVRMSRFFSCLFAVFMGFLSVLLNSKYASNPPP